MSPLLGWDALVKYWADILRRLRGEEIAMADWVIGIDVSEYQGPLKWNTAIEAGARFTFARTSIGSEVDGQFTRNLEKLPIKKANFGFHYGWYFPLITWMDWADQANVFCDLIEDDPDWDLPPVIDMEREADFYGFPTVAQIIWDRLKVPPAVYTTGLFWNNQYPEMNWSGVSIRPSDMDLWIAIWNLVISHPWQNAVYKPISWSDWVFWQFSAGGNNRGREFGAVDTTEADIDIDRFNGDQSALDAYAAKITQLRFGTPVPPSSDLETRVAALEAKDAPSRDEYNGLISFTDKLLEDIDNMQGDLGGLDLRIRAAGALLDAVASKLKDEV